MVFGHLRVHLEFGRGGPFLCSGLFDKQAGQRVEQLGWLDGFAEVGFEQVCIDIRLTPAKRRKQHQWQGFCIPLLADPAGQGYAIHAGHVHVQYGQVERVAALDPL